MIPGHQVLARRIQVELPELDRSVDRVGRAWQHCALNQIRTCLSIRPR